jgi:hypothetical protein
MATASPVRKQRRALDRKHSIYPFGQQVGLVERTPKLIVQTRHSIGPCVRVATRHRWRPRSCSRVGAGELRQRKGEAERLGGLVVDDKLELGRRLHRQVGRFIAFENAIEIAGRHGTGRKGADYTPRNSLSRTRASWVPRPHTAELDANRKFALGEMRFVALRPPSPAARGLR